MFEPYTSFRLVGVARQTVWQGATSSTKRKGTDQIRTEEGEQKEMKYEQQ